MAARPEAQSASRARLIVAIAFLAYFLPLLTARTVLGPVAYWLCIVPAIAIGWCYGSRVGAASGLLCLLINRAVLIVIGAPALMTGAIQNIATVIIVMLIGAMTGKLSEARQQKETQLAAREQAEAVLRESEERYRQLLAEAQHQAQSLALRDRVHAALIGVLDLPTVFRTIVEAIASTYGYTLISIYLLEEDTLVLQHQVGYDQVIARMPITRGVMGRVVRERRTALVTDAQHDPDFQGAISGITSEVSAPIFDNGQVIGVLNVESTASAPFSEADQRVMEALCEYAAIIIERARLHTTISESEQRYRSVIEHAQEVIFQADDYGIWTFLNPAWTTITGFTVEESLGKEALSFVHPDDQEACRQAYRDLLNGQHAEWRGGIRFVSRNGEYRCCEIQLGALLAADGSISGLSGLLNDVTTQQEMTAALQRSEAELRAIVDGAAVGIALADREGNLAKVNPALATLLGYTKDELQGMNFITITHPADRSRNQELYQELLSGKREHFLLEKRFLRKQGGIVWVRLTASLMRGPEVEGRYVVAMIEDITERRVAQEGRRASEERLRAVVSNAPVALFAFDQEGTFTLAEGQGLNLLGMAAGGMVGRSITRVFAQAPWIVDQMQRARAGETFTAIAELAGRVFETSYTPVRDQQGAVTSVIGVATDITRRAAIEAQLTHQAFHDPLTDLPNRACFMDRLTGALMAAGTRGETIGLLFLDLDRFKIINDSLGHDTGDQLLIAVATRLLGCVRPGDTVARLGGDEFTILLDGLVSEREATQVAERITAALQRPFVIDNHEVVITTSIGVVLSHAYLGRDNPAALLSYADMAMYQAKGAGKARYAVFDRRMSKAALARLELEGDLRHGLDRGEFLLHYQPLVDLHSGRIVGTEALVRWQHPQHGLIPPGDFIALAEETGLILSLGRWALREACEQTRRWQEQRARQPLRDSGAPLTISVNLSARQFQDPDLLAEVARGLEETGLPAACLKLEITESVLMEEAEATSGTLEALHSLGIRLAIDDFGTGYSSLGYLKRFPVDTIKIDQTFVANLAHNPEDEAIIGAVVTLGQGLGLLICAEGVETHAQLSRLRQLGVNLGQGYYFARAHPAHILTALFESTDFLVLDGHTNGSHLGLLTATS